MVLEALRAVKYPGFSRDIVSFGLVESAEVRGDEVTVKLSLAVEDPKIAQQIHRECMEALSSVPGVRVPHVVIDLKKPPAAVSPGATRIGGVKHVVAVASGKGGVGKSTVASNLAQALSLGGARTGLCDCDLYGPSIALMFGTTEQPCATEDNRIVPIERYGLKLMSMGFLTDAGTPAVLRGPMVTRYTQQFLRQVDWGDLDYLILDLPPGTGDIQLTVVQTVALAGAVIVTTPQEVALIDARKAVAMFEKTNVRVLGIVENMSYFLCPGDGVRYDIFGSGGGQREADRLGVPLLGEIPIDIATREAGDTGMPVVARAQEGVVGREFMKISGALRAQLDNAPVAGAAA
ncbi:MAG: Mrp/NBP35 family ATP-binding protein [Chthoniobacterales bacterium]|nr:Mrp/NBP35 family ATP-binding protein [Chthoniobacterales bacterium]